MMTARTSVRIMAASMLLGGLAVALFKDVEMGINLFLWVGAIVVSATLIGRGDAREGMAPRWLYAGLAIAALGVAFRGDEMIIMLDIVAMICLLSAMAIPTLRRTGSLLGVETREAVLGGIRAGTRLAAAPFYLLLHAKVAKEEATQSKGLGMVLASGRGVLLVLPVVVVFGALLMSADAGFERLVKSVISLPIQELLPDLFQACAYAWPAGAMLIVGLERLESPDDFLKNSVRLGAPEITSFMVVLNGLFVLFLTTQFSHFFGGAAHVAQTVGLTYAEYARRGFFELVAVCALAIPVLLVMASLIREDEAAVRRFRPLAWLQASLLLLILASAVQRLWLYVDAFGLSLSRLHAAFALAWIGATLGWFALTVLRDRADRFLRGTVTAGAITLGAMHLVNPTAVVVNSWVEHRPTEHAFDAAYLATLGNDAIPSLFEILPRLNEADRATLEHEMVCYTRHPMIKDWREWSLSRSRAVSAWARGYPSLPATTCVTPKDDH